MPKDDTVNLVIKDIPANLHWKFKQACAGQHQTIKETILNLMAQFVEAQNDKGKK